VLFAVCIGLSIALHEFGHLVTAKAFGMKATEYFIGFGPKLFSFRRGETEYGFKGIPAGGYVKIIGMTALEDVDPGDKPRAFYSQKVWKRVVVLSAGSAMHFIIGFVVLYFMAVSMGLPNFKDTPVISEISACVPATQNPKNLNLAPCGPGDPAPAKQAGMRPGDQILAVGGKSTPTYTDVLQVTRQAQGPTPFLIKRGDQQLTLTVDVAKVQRVDVANAKPGQDNPLQTVGGVGLAGTINFRYNALTAVSGATGFTGDMFRNTWSGLMAFPQKIPALLNAIGGGQRDINTPVSVVGASAIGGEAAARGAWSFFLLLLAGLNFFVGVFNLMPLLPLDGGHIAVNLYEKVRDGARRLRGKAAGGPVDYTKLLPVTYAVILVVGAVTLLTVTADIVNPIKLPQ
jgi:membrane-associated protease RseP (regulator of RpoE activity)